MRGYGGSPAQEERRLLTGAAAASHKACFTAAERAVSGPPSGSPPGSGIRLRSEVLKARDLENSLRIKEGF